MHKFSIRQKTKRFWIVASILIVGIIGIIGIFSSTALATIYQPTPDSTYITGKDIGNASFPLIVTNNAGVIENSWGRVLRVTGNNAPIIQPYNVHSFFDLGVDDQGNFFINSPADTTKTSHALTISPTGVVTINNLEL
jgi:hypothetical protein